jgi:hypothetical protein
MQQLLGSTSTASIIPIPHMDVLKSEPLGEKYKFESRSPFMMASPRAYPASYIWHHWLLPFHICALGKTITVHCISLFRAS